MGVCCYIPQPSTPIACVYVDVCTIIYTPPKKKQSHPTKQTKTQVLCGRARRVGRPRVGLRPPRRPRPPPGGHAGCVRCFGGIVWVGGEVGTYGRTYSLIYLLPLARTPIVVTHAGEGCERPCLDDNSKPCGCIDSHCTGAPAPGAFLSISVNGSSQVNIRGWVCRGGLPPPYFHPNPKPHHQKKTIQARSTTAAGPCTRSSPSASARKRSTHARR
jgi:hypothetical protein